jgi:predicted nuclease of restriction endonuclease-like (RecB) superfamily
VREILEAARTGITRTVNTTQVVANWLIGREIVEEEQRGSRRAEYGARLLEELSKNLKQDFGAGYSVQNLRYMRQFYVEFPALIRASPIRHTLRGELPLLAASTPADKICHTPCGESDRSPKDWKPGQLHPNLSWSLYRHLLRVEKPEARSFYEIEATHNNWSARELERQINSLFYERLALSRDKKGLLRLACKGQEIQGPLLNYYDRERRTPGDQPTLGLILCTDKNDAVVRYTLGAEQQEKIFASRYQLHLPTEAELKAVLLRELKCVGSAADARRKQAQRKVKP